jgi:hypothetical protein
LDRCQSLDAIIPIRNILHPHQIGDKISSVGGVDVASITELTSALRKFKDRGADEVIISCTKRVRRRRASDAGPVRAGMKPPSQQDSLVQLKMKAEAGDSNAQFELGTSFHLGRDVPCDETEAVKWWRLASLQGEVEAQSSLGTAYYTGSGLGGTTRLNRRKGSPAQQPDYDEAIRLWTAAAAKGSGSAMTNLACMCV